MNQPRDAAVEARRADVAAIIEKRLGSVYTSRGALTDCLDKIDAYVAASTEAAVKGKEAKAQHVCTKCGYIAVTQYIGEPRTDAESADRVIADLTARLAAATIALKRADGALADAETVQTGDVERGIRQLIAERDTLEHAERALASCKANAEAIRVVAKEQRHRADEAEARLAAAEEDLHASREISGTFWEALKLLNLTHINVANPGSHVADVIRERDAFQQEYHRLLVDALALRATIEALKAAVAQARQALEQIAKGSDNHWCRKVAAAALTAPPGGQG